MKITQFPRLNETCCYERLENGLSVYVTLRPGYQKAYAFLAVNYGGMDFRYRLDGQLRETPPGVAHYLEHKMFDLPQGNALQILSAGGAFPNAFTSSSMTAYHFECTEHFYSNLRTLLSFVTTPYFTPESVAKEQGIIGQEIQMVSDRPQWRVYSNLLQALYDHHPVRVPVAGSAESISHITAETLYDCHRAFYRPENMVLCVTGDVDPERVMAVARMVVSPVKGPAVEKDHGAPEAMEAARAEQIETMPVSAPTFLSAFKAEPSAPGDQMQRLIGDVAGDLLCGTSSPLYQRLYEKGLINQSFGVSYEDQSGTAFLLFGGDSPDPDAVTAEILEEGQRIRREGLPEDRFRRCLKACYGSRIRALNSFEHCCVQLARAHFHGYHYYRFPELYEGITKTDAEAFLDRVVTRERMAVSKILPLGNH